MGEVFFSASDMCLPNRLIPLLDRVLVEAIKRPLKTLNGVIHPEKSGQINVGKVICVGPGRVLQNGQTIPVSVAEGEHVLLPESGGQSLKLQEKNFILFKEDELLGILKDR